jgi:hypothetical protein
MDPEAGADITMDLTKWDKAAAAQVCAVPGCAAAATYLAGPVLQVT